MAHSLYYISKDTRTIGSRRLRRSWRSLSIWAYKSMTKDYIVTSRSQEYRDYIIECSSRRVIHGYNDYLDVRER